VFSPFIISANNELSLSHNLKRFQAFLQNQSKPIGMRELAYTLHSRRSRLPVALAFSASNTEELSHKIQQALSSSQNEIPNNLGTRANVHTKTNSPRIVAVFTGQGAQWATMGTDILSNSSSCLRILANLDASLAGLPNPPSWSLIEELSRNESSSRIHLAEFSQPLCTAVQIMLVDILREAHVPIAAVVGHSSGEIAATYASGLISAEDAICIAYYRGLCTKLAGKSGAMLAVGSSQEDIEELLEEPEFAGRACVGAINSSTNVTVSGDKEAIHELELLLKDEKKFARILKVNQAYHSSHMADCSSAYLKYLSALNIVVSSVPSIPWSSSVFGGSFEGSLSSLSKHYWDINLCNPVRFLQAVRHACESNGPFDLAVEIGPHPALKAPFTQNVHEHTGQGIPYTSLLQRGFSGVATLADGLGFIATHLGESSVDFKSFDNFMTESLISPLDMELPTYSWNHDHDYWHSSRHLNAVLQRSDNFHELLGHLSPHSTEGNKVWRNLIRPKELPWLEGHCIQGQMVFPASGYVIAAFEACLKLIEGEKFTSIEIYEVNFTRALVFTSADSEFETIVNLFDIDRSKMGILVAKFNFNASQSSSNSLDVLASGSVRVCFGEESVKTLPSRRKRATNLMKADSNEFYDALSRLGYGKNCC
jgi:hybrid polyketide synthase/nonribosomal peptide synthetase ACE1